MAGLVNSKVTGQNVAPNANDPIQVSDSADAAAVRTGLRALLAELRANGLIKVLYPELSSASAIVIGATAPTYAITLTNDTYGFVDYVKQKDSWIFDPGTTALTIASIARTSDSVATITFAGTVEAGTFTIQAKQRALNGNQDSTVLSKLATAS